MERTFPPERMGARSKKSFRIALALFLCNGLLIASADQERPRLSVIFGLKGIQMSGTLDSEETAQELARIAHSVRPDLPVINEGLKIDSSVTLDHLSDIKSILTEIGLSTYEGRLQIWPDRVLLGGLTDSLVTETALHLRLEPIAAGRKVIDHICIVQPGDIPDVSPNFTSSNNAAELLDLEYNPTAADAFVAPGIPLEKLFSTVVMLSDFARLTGEKPASVQPLRATPVAAMNTESPSPAVQLLVPDGIVAAPVKQFVDLGLIQFSRNTVTLQSNQDRLLAEMIKQLQSPTFASLPILIEPVKPSTGSSTYNDYVCNRRGEALKEMLASQGVNVSGSQINVTESSNPVDTGAVRVRVELPPPPPEEPAEEEKPDLAQGETPAPDSPVEE